VPAPGEVWVIDTSSVTEVRRKVPRPEQPAVYRELEMLARQGHLVFPAQVLNELRRAHDKKRQDLPLEWAERVEGDAISNPSLETVKNDVLAKVPEVLDPDKAGGPEEADPYILARAVELRRDGRNVTVITQEKTDKPGKLSLSTAAGLLLIPAVTMIPFLKSQGILP
jgi:uncharacterized protein DUF4411